MEESDFFRVSNTQEKQKLTGAVPKCLNPKTEPKELIEANRIQSMRLSETSGSTQNFFKPSIPASKYLNLIDQSDVKWFTEISGRKLTAELKDASEIKAATKETDLGYETKKTERCLIHMPILCPIFNCETYFLPNDMIMHFLSFHYSQQAPIQKIYEKLRLIITFEPFKLVSEEIICLGLVCYGGKVDESDLSLTERNFCVEQNLLLYKAFQPLKGDCPIFILASIINLDEEKYKESDLKFKNKELSKLLIIWLGAAVIKLPIYCTITTYDECRMYSRSVLVGLHSLFEYQSPLKVYKSDNGFFRLFLNELSTFVNGDKILKVEFVFHEDFSIS